MLGVQHSAFSVQRRCGIFSPSWMQRRFCPLQEPLMSAVFPTPPPTPTTPPAIRPPQRTLLGPGPSDVPARILEALARPTIGHLDPVFLQIMDDVRSKLRQVFCTQNEMTLAASG